MMSVMQILGAERCDSIVVHLCVSAYFYNHLAAKGMRAVDVVSGSIWTKGIHSYWY